MLSYKQKSFRACAILLLASLGIAPAAGATEDPLVVRVGAMHVNGDVRLRGQVDDYAPDIGYGSERFKFADKSVPRIEGSYHVSARNRLLFNYFRYAPDRDYTLDEDIVLEGQVLPAGSTATAGTRFKLGTLAWDGALVETPQTSLGVQFGIAWGTVEGHLAARVRGRDLRTSEYRHGFAPVLGARFARRSAGGRWQFIAQGQYVNANWGNMERYNGDLTRLNALVEYRPGPHLGLHLGYDAFRLDIDHDFGLITGGAVLRFAGPFAGLSFAL